MKDRKFRNLIGAQVRRLRCTKGWSQERLLSKLQEQGWHICRTHLARIEAGEVWVGDFELMLIARALQVSIPELLPKIGEEKPLYTTISGMLKGQIRTLMSPDEILAERSRPLLLGVVMRDDSVRNCGQPTSPEGLTVTNER